MAFSYLRSSSLSPLCPAALPCRPSSPSSPQVYDLKGSWVGRNADPPTRGQRVRCYHCGEKYEFAGWGEKAGGKRNNCPERGTKGHQPAVTYKVSEKGGGGGGGGGGGRGTL